MICYFFCILTVISKNKYYPPEENNYYPDIIEIGFIISDNDKILYQYSSLIKPYNFKKLDPIITNITKITTNDILQKGENLEKIINILYESIIFFDVKIINSYNLNFDLNVLISQLYKIHNKKNY